MSWRLETLINVLLCVVSTVLFFAAGRPVFAVGAIVIVGYALAVRRWLLQRMDAGLQARDAGAPGAVGQLRALHVKSMLIHVVLLAVGWRWGVARAVSGSQRGRRACDLPADLSADWPAQLRQGLRVQPGFDLTEHVGRL